MVWIHLPGHWLYFKEQWNGKEIEGSIERAMEKNLSIKLNDSDCGNPMTSKMVDWKIHTNLRPIKTIQYDAVGGVLDCFYTSEEDWIFNPPFLNPLD